MTTILNPSFESGYTNWSYVYSGAGGNGISTTTGVTNGTKSMRTTTNSGVVNGYHYMTQSINFNSDFTMLFDYYDAASSEFDVVVYIDSNVELQTTLSGGGQNTNVPVVFSGYSGSHTLKIGIKSNTTPSTNGSVYLDNIRVTSETATVFYVKASGGADSNDGTSWANAWATVNKAATTVPDGTTVHIGFGTYNAEPANNDVAPVNAGAVGIKYLPETATTGGGTGSVIVEVN